MSIPKDYLTRLYGGWYGKIIGIRHGSNVEGWTSAKISEVYGEVEHYLFSFRHFAADDDSNGPIFFIRALEDHTCSEEITPQEMAETFLNYAPCEHGFLWWGGYGNSTEHTAYLNLLAGIRAPFSGSAKLNGTTVAEQIGGQIFNDVWGLVSPCNHRRAARLAAKMASVTHDGNGIYGGMFMAACVSAAFDTHDIAGILHKGLSVIPAGCSYRQMAEDLTGFHQRHPENWRDCLAYVQDRYGYDRYPGNCHIIPNAAAVVLSLLYGKGDFSRTINICNMCGWDTDCNVGNVGMILGVMNGIENIRRDWIAPIGDFLACSSVLGGLNLRDIANDALYMASLGYRLAGETPPADIADHLSGKAPRFSFVLPESTHSFQGEGAAFVWENRPASDTSGGRCLTARISSCPGKVKIYRQTYYRPSDFSDDRYRPSFTPELFPGQEIRFRITAEKPAWFCPFAEDLYSGKIIRGERTFVSGWTVLKLSLPASGACIVRVGLETDGDNTVSIDYLAYEGKADYVLDFSKAGREFWNVFHIELGQTSHSKGIWDVIDGKAFGSCADHGEIFTGDRSFADYAVTAHFCPEFGRTHLICARVQGNLRGYLAGFRDDELVILKNDMGQLIPLASRPFPWENGKEYKLTFSVRGGRLELSAGQEMLLSAQDGSSLYPDGCFGFSLRRGSRSRLISFHLKEF